LVMKCVVGTGHQSTYWPCTLQLNKIHATSRKSSSLARKCKCLLYCLLHFPFHTATVSTVGRSWTKPCPNTGIPSTTSDFWTTSFVSGRNHVCKWTV
jgi:hypothetical protein